MVVFTGEAQKSPVTSPSCEVIGEVAAPVGVRASTGIGSRLRSRVNVKLEDALDCADMQEEEVSSASATASGGGDGMAGEGGTDSHAEEDERVDASDSEGEVDSGMGNQGPALLRGDVHDGGHDGCVVCQRAAEESEGDKAVSYEVDAAGVTARIYP